MFIHLQNSLLRKWNTDDAESLVRYANNKKIANNLRDAFPYPYTIVDARLWLENIANDEKNIIFAIDINGEAIGSVGIHALNDVYFLTGELGYWLAEPYWNKGIVTEAVKTVVDYTFKTPKFERIQACIFSNNYASMRVLEKAGFTKEAIHKNAVCKNGIIMDEHVYAKLR